MSPTEIFYVVIGLMAIALVFYANAPLYKAGGKAAGTSALEASCYLVAVIALLVGWYFNFEYFRTYGEQAGWWHWTELLFVNPASASGGQDLIIGNLILLPLWTILDARRTGMKWGWWYFPMSLLTSYAFAIALFLAVRERQLRWNAK
jgi:heme/copper-type cytochrome/quinol oxidase subunit 2